jgi:hypothetical protein
VTVGGTFGVQGKVQRTRRRYEDIDVGWEEPYADDGTPRSSVLGYALAGLTLFAAFGVAGNYFGNNAIAHTAAATTIDFDELVSPATSAILGKGSMLEGATVRLVSLGDDQQTLTTGKGDFLDVGLVRGPVAGDPLTTSLSPSIAKLEHSFRVGDAQKRKLQSLRRFRLAEQDCLARAVYFEARSEPEMGQLAVAKVVLNRVKDPNYPKTICGVVYQGSDRNNSCQFSFACDGLSDQPTVRSAWKQANEVAAKAMAGDKSIEIMTAATHYHADYVTPKWAASFKRVIKIGRHIFYSDS